MFRWRPSSVSAPRADEAPQSAPPKGAFYLLGIGISTNVDAFIPLARNALHMRFRPEGPRIPVPNWLIEWSKSRDLFLTLAHDPWVFRPN